MKSFLVLNPPSEHLRKPGYRKVAKSDTKLSCGPDFETRIEEFARNFGFETIELEISMEFAQDPYSQMRNMILRPLKT
jgi:hypothetical protein